MEVAAATMPRIIPVEYTQKETTPAKLSIADGKNADWAIDITQK